MKRREFVKSTLLAGMITGASRAMAEEAPFRPISTPFAFQNRLKEAPFGGAVSSNIVNYTRLAPYVGAAGLLKGDGVEEAQRLGFALIIDLRRPDENGVAEEQEAASRIGVDYLNLPLAADERAWDQVDTVALALEDPQRFPVLLHCVSANRVGALWALYRTRHGAPATVAIEEGRTAGLKSREPLVRQLLAAQQQDR